jgi:hypothetical protein
VRPPKETSNLALQCGQKGDCAAIILEVLKKQNGK